MSDMFAYLRWRILVGLAMMMISALGIVLTGKGVAIGYHQPSAEETEQARKNWKEYQAEREIRQARRTDGYDPSDPSVVRDGYQTDEYYNRETYSNSEP